MENCLVVFQCKEANKVADRIAKEALSTEHNVSILYSILPNWLNLYVENDKNSM